MSPPGADADTWYLALSGFEDVAFRLDVGFEAECGRIAVYGVAGEDLAYLADTVIGNGLSIDSDAMTGGLSRIILSQKPKMDTTLGVTTETLRFDRKQKFNHLEYRFFSGRAHTVKNKTLAIAELAGSIVGVVNDELARFAAVLNEELSGGSYGRLTAGVPFPYHAGFVSGRRDYVFLMHSDPASPTRGKTFAFHEQATLGVPCADVGLLVLALLSLVLEKTKNSELVTQKTIISTIWEAVHEHTADKLGSALAFLLLYQYFTERYLKGAMLFIRTPLLQVLERFADRRAEAIKDFFNLEEELRGKLTAPEMISPKEYIDDVLSGEYHAFGTTIDMKDDKILIEFRALHRILDRHMTLHRGLRRAGSLVVSPAKI
jgi:hypothetical protein